MSETKTNKSDVDKHVASDIDTIIVDPDDIITLMRQQKQYENDKRTPILRIKPPFEGIHEPSLAMIQGRYALNVSPKPIHFRPAAFITGDNDRNNGEFPDECMFPYRDDSKARFRDKFDYWTENGEVRELSDEEESEWDDWWNAELEFWEAEVRKHLKDQTILSIETNDRRITTTIDIRYEKSSA